MRKALGLVTMSALVVSPAAAQNVSANQVCADEEAAVQSLEQQAAPRIKQLQDEGDALKDEMPQGPVISGEIQFVDSHIALDLPSVTMKLQQVSFNTPQVTMRERAFSFKVPEVKMVAHHFPGIPSITCNWHGCSTHSHDIVTNVPEITMVTKRGSTKVPEVAMRRTDVATKIPSVTMQRQDLFYKLPHITVADPIPDSGPVEEKGKALQNKAAKLSGEIESEGAVRTQKLFACHANALRTQRAETSQQFEDAAGQLKSAIESIKKIGGDPANFTPDDGPTMNLVAQLDDLLKQRDAALASIDASIIELETNGNTGILGASNAVAA